VRLLIDENISPIIGDALRVAGHDVRAAAVACPGVLDEELVALAIAEARIVVSEDKDFGNLAFQRGLCPPGLILVRLPGYLPAEKAVRLVTVLKRQSAKDCILVIDRVRARRRLLP
jgi:predicted nuclease of predicted toxin-antitoxin system